VARHLLVSNDFPPKLGGIQSYLWELWRRLPPEDTVVYCTPYRNSAAFDASQPFRIERSPEPVLLPYPWLAKRICDLADEVGAELVLLDPAVPLGLVGPRLGRPYGVVLHGAEVTIPGRLPGAASALRRVLRGASLVVSAGSYALAEAERCAGRSLPSVVVPPGVDTSRFQPFSSVERHNARRRFGLDKDALVVSSVNRLVPRKGMDFLIAAAAELAPARPDLTVVIAGTGRDQRRLHKLAGDLGAPVEFPGRIADDAVQALYGASDLMAMLCHDRWWGLEQEGFGIAFLEAAAVGIPQVAGRSGGAAEAVLDGVTGLVVQNPRSLDDVVASLATLLDDPDRRRQMGRAARTRALEEFDYNLLADRLSRALTRWETLEASDR